MDIKSITYTDTKHREVTYEVPKDKRLTRLSIYSEDMLLQFDGGGTPEKCVVLVRLENTDIQII